METKLDELALKKEWNEKARKMTLENLPAFIDELMSYEHEYGTIVNAIGAAATAAAYAIQHSPQGGITGFQGSCVKWAFLEGWDRSMEGKAYRLLNIDDMLFPQYEYKFNTIDKETFKILQEKAQELLKEDRSHPEVKTHLENIINGKVPFGYKLKDL